MTKASLRAMKASIGVSGKADRPAAAAGIGPAAAAEPGAYFSTMSTPSK